ncbi:MAG: L,D-transpeptidase family protein [Verrucomicrobiota bacterium]|nr:L,D-transpeptidase family protein [Verrucomicrobiota bacterium]
MKNNWAKCWALLGTVLFLAGCESNNTNSAEGWSRYPENEPRVVQTVNPELQPMISPERYQWLDQNATGPVKITINRGEQKLYVYRGGQLVGWTKVSTGKESHGTPSGKFSILQKDANHKSNLYGTMVNRASGTVVDADAGPRDRVPKGAYYRPSPMPYFMRLTNSGVGLHQGYVPEYPASHGCIRLPAEFASQLYSMVRLGTPVTII